MRRRFDHLVEEISRAVGASIPRYQLWLRLHEHGCDPEKLTGAMAAAFCDGPLAGFLAENDLRITRLRVRHLRAAIERFDPELPPRGARLATLPD